MTQDFHKGETTKRYDIPLSHLDYDYVKACKDVKELEKIIRILRSGDEGCYPELEKEALDRLEILNPKSRALRKDNPVVEMRDLDQSERSTLVNDMESWTSVMASKDPENTGIVRKKPVTEELGYEDDESLPPVRTPKTISMDGKVVDDSSKKADKSSKKKKPLPRSYQEWDKVDIDQELEKIDKEEPAKPKPEAGGPSTFKPESISEMIDTKGMSEEEKRARALREKDKGNEAFHAKDFLESLLYYSRSISISPLAATYNNRALAYVRLSKWDEAIKDCNTVLELEPQNVKAMLRRGTALKGKQDLKGAKKDLQKVLAMESNNKTAKDLLEEISTVEAKAAKKRKEEGRRMIIEEVDGSEEEEEENDEEVTEEIMVEKPDSEKKKPDAEKKASKEQTVPLMNGHANEPSKTNADSSKDIWAEDEEDEIIPTKPPADDAKPKLMATNILGEDQKATEHFPSANESQGAGDASHKKADGDSKLMTEAEMNHQNEQVVLSDDTKKQVIEVDDKKKQVVASDDGKKQVVEVDDKKKQVVMSDDKQKQVTVSDDNNKQVLEVSKEQERDESASESSSNEEEEEEDDEESPPHARPIYIQRAYPAAEAALKEEGNTFFRSGQYPDAIEVYTRLIAKLQAAGDAQVVNSSIIYSNRAACYLKIGDCQSAISDCETSLSLVPHSPKPLLRRAAAYETLEKYRQAYVDYKQVLRIDSSAEVAHQGATRCQHYLHKLDGHRWREKLPPLVHVSHWDVPEILDEAAANAASTSPTSVPQVPQTTSSRVPKKVSSTKSAAKSAPPPAQKVPSPEERFEETKTQGNKHVQKGEFAAAVKCYCQCVDLFPDRAAIYTNRALCYLKLHQAAEAEEDCSKALALEPNNSKAFYRRALARKDLKQYKDSLQDLLQLLRLEPANTAAKKEMDTVKRLYKQEYDQLKSHPPSDKKTPPKAEKQRKRMNIVEVDDDSESEEKVIQHDKPKGKGKQKGGVVPSVPPMSTIKPTPTHPNSVPAAEKATPASTGQEARKPGRAKPKKGAAKQTSVGLPTAAPSAPKLQGKITPFEFLQHWNSLKQAKDIQPYVQLMEQISPDDLPHVISNKLDGHMLQIIARCAAHDAQTGEVERAYRILRNVRQVPRFSTVVMFLSNKEKQDIKKVLESVNISEGHSADEVTSVRKDYGLK